MSPETIRSLVAEFNLSTSPTPDRVLLSILADAISDYYGENYAEPLRIYVSEMRDAQLCYTSVFDLDADDKVICVKGWVSRDGWACYRLSSYDGIASSPRHTRWHSFLDHLINSERFCDLDWSITSLASLSLGVTSFW